MSTIERPEHGPEEAETDVLIVGYGPVGAMTALLLAEAGVRVTVIDRDTEVCDLPRAVGLDGESVRAYQRIGLGEGAAALLHVPRARERVAFTDSKRREHFGMDIAQEGVSGWRDVAFFDQPELEVWMRGELERRPAVRRLLGHEVEALEQDASGVQVRGRRLADGRPFAVRAAWGIGCDGASSFVRRACGIGWKSLGYDQDWLVIDVLQRDGAKLPWETLQVCDPERLTTYVCVKEPNRRWEFQLRPGETREEMLRPERIRSLLAPWVAPEHYTIRRAAVYQFHAATAERWRAGRVLLAGDAAHQTPPFLGQGLNAGMRDAWNLAWKLPLVLSGTCPEALLDSYEAERDPHARDLVDWAVAVGKLMEALAAREAGREEQAPAPGDQRSGYGQGRSVPPLTAGVLVDAQTGGEGPAGHVFAQPTLRTASGAERRLDDLVGPGFALVGRTEADLAVKPASQRILERLGATTLSLEGAEVVRGTLDRAFERSPAVLVRPDRYVFGVVDADWPLDALVAELGRKLGLDDRQTLGRDERPDQSR